MGNDSLTVSLSVVSIIFTESFSASSSAGVGSDSNSIVVGLLISFISKGNLQDLL